MEPMAEATITHVFFDVAACWDERLGPARAREGHEPLRAWTRRTFERRHEDAVGTLVGLHMTLD